MRVFLQKNTEIALCTYILILRSVFYFCILFYFFRFNIQHNIIFEKKIINNLFIFYVVLLRYSIESQLCICICKIFMHHQKENLCNACHCA
jgi:hypothetical protein